MEDLEFVFETPVISSGLASSDSGKSQSDSTSDSAVNISVTEQAKQKLRALHQQSPDKMLRISVKAGGCSGYQYEFLLDNKSDAAKDDFVTHGDVSLLLDNISAGFLTNAIVDYQKKLSGESFHIINPNAVNSCGCGVSFSA
ncbi:MAG: iron-sulfur cluster assembly accessory protein [Alphaproteobacteria bacterium]|nr:iron-sulfur cluster assembly accessory protein [Alphaproteobacteria bacterium]